jgi:hypothetical protein
VTTPTKRRIIPVQTDVCCREEQVVDMTRSELTEKELDTLITRRHERRVNDEGHRPSEGLRAASERAYFARRDEDRCLERLTPTTRARPPA